MGVKWSQSILFILLGLDLFKKFMALFVHHCEASKVSAEE